MDVGSILTRLGTLTARPWAFLMLLAYAAFWLIFDRHSLNWHRLHLDLHITPFIGETRLTALNILAVRAFEDRLREGGRSQAMVHKGMVGLGSLLADAQERGLTGHNVIQDIRGRRKGGERRQERRQKGRLKVGEDIPTREIKALVGALSGRWRPLLLTAIFTGLRASELRGLRWRDVDLDRREIHVRQRADHFNEIGKPKSISGERKVPAPPIVINALREWKLACPKGKLDLVFPNGAGHVEQLNNIIAVAYSPRLWPLAWPSTPERWTRTASRSWPPGTRACTPCGISMRHGASTGRKTAVSACLRKSCRNAWGTRPSP